MFLTAVMDDTNFMTCNKTTLNAPSYKLHFENKAFFTHKHKTSIWKG